MAGKSHRSPSSKAYYTRGNLSFKKVRNIMRHSPEMTSRQALKLWQSTRKRFAGTIQTKRIAHLDIDLMRG